MTLMNTEPADSNQALTEFADASTTPEARRAALTALITSKFLPKYAGNDLVITGRRLLLERARSEYEPTHRLLAIAESIRLTQVVKRWAAETLEQLRTHIESELPEVQLLIEADDRLNLARACAQIEAPWMAEYLSRAIAAEETGEKARAEMLLGVFAQSGSLSEVMRRLSDSFALLRPVTEAPGDTLARRLTRTLSALRDALLESELEAGDGLGDVLHELIARPLSAVGKPQDERVRIDLSREMLLTVHDIVRTRISVAADASIYSVVSYCRKLCGGASWPDELKKPLERLITDVSEAIILLGKQGLRDQALLAQFEVLTNFPERARALARVLVSRHPELPEDVRDWLEHGRVRPSRQASESAIEAAASNADQSIGLALQLARQVRSLRDSLSDPLLSNLQIYDPVLSPVAQELLDGVRSLTVQVEQAATLRGLDLYGTPGSEVEVSTKFFNVVGVQPRQTMVVKQAAIVRKRSDGSVGDVVTKGLVE